MYNLVHGINNLAPVLLKILNIDQKKESAPKYPEEWSPYDDGETDAGKKYIQECIEQKYYESGRFRDIYLNEDGTKIILFTRNGGGNRESYFYIFDILKTHPNYITDYDDDFDCTYAYIEFSVPEEYKEALKQLSTGEKPKTLQEILEWSGFENTGENSEHVVIRDENAKNLFNFLNQIFS